MKLPPKNVRTLLSFPAICLILALAAVAQEPSGPSLGELARKTRQEHSGRASATKISSEEDDGPDSGGVWRVRYCKYSPCYELSITLPRKPKWTRADEQPRPVLIPVTGHEDDASHAIRVYAAESLDPMYFLDKAERTFVQGWFARPEYFGQAAHIVLDEHVQIEGGAHASIAHFTITTPSLKYRGLSVVAATLPGSHYGFACVFREEDSAASSSICDAIIKSAHSQTLEPAKHPLYPSAPPSDNDPE